MGVENALFDGAVLGVTSLSALVVVLVAAGAGALGAGLGFGLGLRRSRPRHAEPSGRTPATSESDPADALPGAALATREPAASASGKPVEEPDEPPEESTHGTLYPVRLISQALRDPLHRLRRTPDVPPELIARLERLAWQARMLVSRPRPMQSLPTAPISLLQEAAEQVEALRLGKVNASWTLLTRQPVHVDPDRTRGAFRELLASGTEAAGEAGRLGIRVVPGPNESRPVLVEIEIGRRGAEVDSLSALVARQLLETQGAKLEIDGRVVRVHLRVLTAG